MQVYRRFVIVAFLRVCKPVTNKIASEMTIFSHDNKRLRSVLLINCSIDLTLYNSQVSLGVMAFYEKSSNKIKLNDLHMYSLYVFAVTSALYSIILIHSQHEN